MGYQHKDTANVTKTFRSEAAAGGQEFPASVVGSLPRVYKGVQSLTLSASSQSLTVPSGATHADISFEATDPANDFARYWHGATAPTAAAGHKLKDDQMISSAAPAVFKAIVGVGGGTLRVEYYAYE